MDQKGALIVLDWLYAGIAVELVLDCREIRPRCSLVRLENGRLPDGYISNGKLCRSDLRAVVRERRWPIDDQAPAGVTRGKKDRYQSRNLATMKSDVTAWKQLIMSCADRIILEGAILPASS
jgi:hypothetical protein